MPLIRRDSYSEAMERSKNNEPSTSTRIRSDSYHEATQYFIASAVSNIKNTRVALESKTTDQLFRMTEKNEEKSELFSKTVKTMITNPTKHKLEVVLKNTAACAVKAGVAFATGGAISLMFPPSAPAAITGAITAAATFVATSATNKGIKSANVKGSFDVTPSIKKSVDNAGDMWSDRLKKPFPLTKKEIVECCNGPIKSAAANTMLNKALDATLSTLCEKTIPGSLPITTLMEGVKSLQDFNKKFPESDKLTRNRAALEVVKKTLSELNEARETTVKINNIIQKRFKDITIAKKSTTFGQKIKEKCGGKDANKQLRIPRTSTIDIVLSGETTLSKAKWNKLHEKTLNTIDEGKMEMSTLQKTLTERIAELERKATVSANEDQLSSGQPDNL